MMNFLEAAFEILSRAQEPLHYTEITQQALRAGILDTKGQTPEASMGSRLYVDTKRANSRFKRVSRGVFGLATPPSKGISGRINRLNKQTRKTLRERLAKMPPDRFEGLVAELLLAIGFEEESIEITPFGNDGGVDVRGVLNAGGLTKVNAAVQAKRWKNNVSSPVVQALRGSLVVHEQGIIITTSGFSKGAIAEAKAPGKVHISLIDGPTLLNLLIEHHIGITAEEHVVYSLDEEWWADVAEETEHLLETSKDTSEIALKFPLKLRCTVKGTVKQAEMLNQQGEIRFEDHTYQSPSGAGKAASGWQSCNGWTFWQYFDEATQSWQAIQELGIR